MDTMVKRIGYARVSTKQQSTDRQEADLLAAGVRHDDLYIDQGVSGARATWPQFDRTIKALIEGDTLVSTTLDRLGRSTQNMLALANELRTRGAGLRVLNPSIKLRPVQLSTTPHAKRSPASPAEVVS